MFARKLSLERITNFLLPIEPDVGRSNKIFLFKGFFLNCLLKAFDRNEEQARNAPPQRKTTLKWSDDGELSSIDMTRILAKLEASELRQCDISCDVDQQ